MAESGGNAVEIEPIVTQEIQANAEAERPPEQAQESQSEQQADQEAKQTQPEKQGGGGYKKKLNKAQEEIARLTAELASAKAVASPEKPLVKPKPDDYQTWQEYEDARDAWLRKEVAAEAIQSLKAENQEEKSRNEYRAKKQAYEASLEKAKEIYPDYDEVTESYDGPLTVQMRDEMLNSDMGAEVAYYLAKNPDEAERISEMTVRDMIRAMGRIEAKIEAGKSGKAVKTTQAPPPVTPIRASSKVTPPNDRGYVEVA